MIGLVRSALRRPYTAAIAAMLIMMMGGLAVSRMIVDIFPVIDIPVVMVTRPQLPDGVNTVATVDEAADWVAGLG